MALENLSKLYQENLKLSKLNLDDKYVMVAAIDFGTTFSGYAFSFKTNKEKIMMNKSWGENVGFQSYKTPTCLMVDSANTFHAFGYDAEQKYSQLEEEDDSNDYQLYRHFKMILHDVQQITKYNKVTSIDGKMTFALDIFAMALKYLKDHLVEVVSQQAKGATAELIQWVITVPAIWNEEAKQFMREAAYKAGMIKTKDSRQLIIALEPEAASVFCRSLDLNQFIAPSGKEPQPSFRAGTKYLVIDAGGGTVDLTAHEVLSSGGVKEIHTANGGAWGGTKVDDNFVMLMKQVLGDNFVCSFQRQCPQQWLLFMVNFERLKRSAKPDGECKISIAIPFAMGEKYKEIHSKGIDKAIKEAQHPGVSFSNGMMVLEYDVVVSLFKTVIDNIVSHLEKLLKVPAMRGCSYFLLVGGFAESALLQKAIMDNFRSHVNVLVPEEAQMSVIKGAVLFGHRPNDIEVRKARFTYGASSISNFNPLIHDRKYLTVVEGTEKCSQLFDIFVKKGNDVKVGDTKRNTYTPVEHGMTSMTIGLYQSDNADVKYVDEEGVKQLGQVRVEMPNVEKDMDRRVEVEMTFGGTEIKVEAHDVQSGSRSDTAIDFLGD